MTDPRPPEDAPTQAPETVSSGTVSTSSPAKASRPSRHRGQANAVRGKPIAPGERRGKETEFKRKPHNKNPSPATRFGGERANPRNDGGKPKKYREVIEGLQDLTGEVRDRMMEIIRTGTASEAGPVIRLFFERAWGRAPALMPGRFDESLTKEEIDRQLEKRLLALALSDTPDPGVLITVMKERGLIKRTDGEGGGDDKPTGVNLVPDGQGRPGHRLEDSDDDAGEDA
ncbi:MAG: hypothetical protein ACK52I_01715 [Pseudomonadota bacterium]|jgi:hypothetical protein